jgi:hypothetical protein
MRDIEDNFVSADHARQQPCLLLPFLKQPTQAGLVEVGLDIEQAVWTEMETEWRA